MPVRDKGTRQDTWQIRLQVDGTSHNGSVWDKKSGGELDSDEVKYNPGGMANPISLGGKRMTGNVTLQRLYDRADDHDRINELFNAVGRGKVTIGVQPMDPDGNVYGKTIHYHGILKRVSTPDVDSESNTAALVEIECTVGGYPSA